MARAGMTTLILLAHHLTRRFGASKEFGRIAAGMVGDLTVLRGDPSADVRAFAAVAYTIRDGRVIYRDPLLKPSR